MRSEVGDKDYYDQEMQTLFHTKNIRTTNQSESYLWRYIDIMSVEFCSTEQTAPSLDRCFKEKAMQ
jgi:hypothetical protein